VIGEYVFDGEGGRHQAFYAPLRDTVVMDDLIRPHDRIQVEESLKYSPAEAQKLWKLAGMAEMAQWRHVDEYGECTHIRSCLRPGLSARAVLRSQITSPLWSDQASRAITPRMPRHVGPVVWLFTLCETFVKSLAQYPDTWQTRAASSDDCTSLRGWAASPI
jgi:hypothetical protein